MNMIEIILIMFVGSIILLPFMINCLFKKKEVVILNVSLTIIAFFITYVLNTMIIHVFTFREFEECHGYIPILYFFATFIVEIMVIMRYFTDKESKDEFGKYWWVGIIITVVIGFLLFIICSMFRGILNMAYVNYPEPLSVEELSNYTKWLVALSSIFSVTAINYFVLFAFKNKEIIIKEESKNDSLNN